MRLARIELELAGEHAGGAAGAGTAKRWGPGRRLAALSGDLATDRDARRLRASGIPALSITTGSACHLDARMVHDALHELPADPFDTLFIENVGNLVPAIYDLGQERDVVLVSVTEGEDKPLKYPVMFRRADLVVVTKTDLLPLLPEFRLDVLGENLARVMPEPLHLAVSARTGAGLDAWLAWLDAARVARPGMAAGDGRCPGGPRAAHPIDAADRASRVLPPGGAAALRAVRPPE
jgi:hydrogenase nickel incorporation protein HypB